MAAKKSYAQSKHVVLDIETLGTKRNSAVLSIGAVSIVNLEVVDKFHIHLDVNQQTTPAPLGDGRYIDFGTVSWWLNQTHEARKGQTDAKRYSVGEAEVHFADFMKRVDADFVWGNAPGFDCDILEDLFGTKYWPFYAERDVRTLRGAFMEDFSASVAHDALSDSIGEAEMLIRIFKLL